MGFHPCKKSFFTGREDRTAKSCEEKFPYPEEEFREKGGKRKKEHPEKVKGRKKGKIFEINIYFLK